MKVWPEFIGLGATEALKLALKKGVHLEFGDGAWAPGRVHVRLEDGLVAQAWEETVEP